MSGHYYESIAQIVVRARELRDAGFTVLSSVQVIESGKVVPHVWVGFSCFRLVDGVEESYLLEMAASRELDTYDPSTLEGYPDLIRSFGTSVPE